VRFLLENRGLRITEGNEGGRGLDSKAGGLLQIQFHELPRLKCAEGATEISPGLEQRDYPGFTSHKIILPLLLDRGEKRDF